jgi:hypothetical protein
VAISPGGLTESVWRCLSSVAEYASSRSFTVTQIIPQTPTLSKQISVALHVSGGAIGRNKVLFSGGEVERSASSAPHPRNFSNRAIIRLVSPLFSLFLLFLPLIAKEKEVSLWGAFFLFPVALVSEPRAGNRGSVLPTAKDIHQSLAFLDSREAMRRLRILLNYSTYVYRWLSWP